MKKGTLCEIKLNAEKTVYGNYLTTDSDGRYVMEMLGEEKGIAAFDKKAVEKVMPFTISVKYLTNGSNDNHYHFLVDDEVKYEFKKGDVVWATDYGALVEITGVDTKNERATKPLKGFVLNTAAKL